jgi:uncharacterized membrane protein YeiH
MPLPRYWAASSYYVLLRAGAGEAGAMLGGMGVIILMRLLAYKYEWDLPRISDDEKQRKYILK